MEKKELICINCPLGCILTVETKDKEVVNVTGNTCPRGRLYAQKEILNPTRIVTSVVNVKGGKSEMLPVKTQHDIPKEKIFNCLCSLKGVVVEAPVYIGDVIVTDAGRTGVDFVATKDVLKN